tara:strand:- start:402 stop:581 length:180 start_codon:yes stop_codon:yes gene_type:complete
MKYTKKQKEIIAYCVSIVETDEDVKPEIRASMQLILATFQSEGVWGRVEIYEDEEGTYS